MAKDPVLVPTSTGLRPSRLYAGGFLEGLQELHDKMERQRALGPHPVEIALRDISIGLSATGRWDDFVRAGDYPVMTIGAIAPEEEDRTRFDNLIVWGSRPGTAEREAILTEIVRAIMIRKGLTPAELVGRVDCTPIRATRGSDLSAHKRIAIITDIAQHLREIEAMSPHGE